VPPLTLTLMVPELPGQIVWLLGVTVPLTLLQDGTMVTVQPGAVTLRLNVPSWSAAFVVTTTPNRPAGSVVVTDDSVDPAPQRLELLLPVTAFRQGLAGLKTGLPGDVPEPSDFR
jgi:hypothetical protein